MWLFLALRPANHDLGIERDPRLDGPEDAEVSPYP